MAINSASHRLLFKPFKSDQFDEFYSWYGNEQVMEKVTGKALNHQECKEHFKAVIELNKINENFGYYAVYTKTEDKPFIGVAKFSLFADDKTSAEIGYGLLPEYWGNKYADEILKHLIDHALQHTNIKTLTGIVMEKNKSSIHILEQNRFRYFKSKHSDNIKVLFYKLELN